MYCIECGKYENRLGGLLCSSCVINEIEPNSSKICSQCEKELRETEVIYCHICKELVCIECCGDDEEPHVCIECLEEGE